MTLNILVTAGRCSSALSSNKRVFKLAGREAREAKVSAGNSDLSPGSQASRVPAGPPAPATFPGRVHQRWQDTGWGLPSVLLSCCESAGSREGPAPSTNLGSQGC